jgi:hypothetical protein
MQRWTVEVSEEGATFSGAPRVEDHTAARALPRVWAGRGLGLPDDEVPGLASALREVMNTHAYWTARHRHGGTQEGRGGADDWSVPRRDDDDGFVYITGPCGHWNGDAGYRPAAAFTLWLPDVRGLRIRLVGYLGLQSRSDAVLWRPVGSHADHGGPGHT